MAVTRSRSGRVVKAVKRAASPPSPSPSPSPSPAPAPSPPPQKRAPRKRAKKTAGSAPAPSPPPGPTPVPPPPRAGSPTVFHGRLGYACLNTLLRKEKPPVFCSRTVRLATIRAGGPETLLNVSRDNIRDLVKTIEWNGRHAIGLMRVSSDLCPFASHNEVGWSVDLLSGDFAVARQRVKEWGGRLTMHPGQYTQLGSPKESVVTAAKRDLEVHASILDLLGAEDAVIVIHGGGVYGDRAAALQRLEEEIETLPPSVRNKLVLENDEISWSAEELLPLCKRLGVPLVFDFHHDMLRPSRQTPEELIPEIETLWAQRGARSKYHHSEARGGVSLRDRRAHAGRCLFLPPLPPGADLMVEAKDKEQAVFDLARIYGLQEQPLDGREVHASGMDLKEALAVRDDMILRAQEIRAHLKDTGRRLKYERGAGEEPLGKDDPDAVEPTAKSSAEFKAERMDEPDVKIKIQSNFKAAVEPRKPPKVDAA